MSSCPARQFFIPVAVSTVYGLAWKKYFDRCRGRFLTGDLGAYPCSDPVDKLIVANFNGDLTGDRALREVANFELNVEPTALSHAQHVLTNLLEKLHQVGFAGVSTLRLARLVGLGHRLKLETPALLAAAWSMAGGYIGAARRRFNKGCTGNVLDDIYQQAFELKC